MGKHAFEVATEPCSSIDIKFNVKKEGNKTLRFFLMTREANDPTNIPGS